jgi:hypothetical protein
MAMHSPRTVQYDSGGGTTSTSLTLARIAPPVLSSAYDHGTPRKTTQAFLRTSGVQQGLEIFSNMKHDRYFQNLLGFVVPVDTRRVKNNGLAGSRICSSGPALYQHRYEVVTHAS